MALLESLGSKFKRATSAVTVMHAYTVPGVDIGSDQPGTFISRCIRRASNSVD